MEIVGVLVAICVGALGAGELVRTYLLRALAAPLRAGTAAMRTRTDVHGCQQLAAPQGSVLPRGHRERNTT